MITMMDVWTDMLHNTYFFSKNHTASTMMAAHDEEYSILLLRHLQQQQQQDSNDTAHNRGRAALMVLYLCVLCMCFLTPLVYYCRLQCEERYNRHLAHLDAAGLSVALEQSQQESRAVRRKYIEERRARILQLFAPVRMILTEEHFSMETKELMPSNQTYRIPMPTTTETVTTSEQDDNSPPQGEEVSNDDDDEATDNGATEEEDKSDTKEKEGIYTADAADENDLEMADPKKTNNSSTAAATTTIETTPQTADTSDNPYGEDDSLLICIPEPGLHLTGGERQRQTRLVPGLCTICLCVYEPGSDVVWSSNSACEHVFHEQCIEKWLMKQREGPLCPCCRRDFIVDPFDDLEDGKLSDSADLWIQRTFSDETAAAGTAAAAVVDFGGSEPPTTTRTTTNNSQDA